MNTRSKNRKRALFSSLAMLLVAMIALSAATYAWFVNSATATVEGINVEVTAPDGLLISETGADGTWSNKITLTGTDTLAPVSGFQDDDNPDLTKMYSAGLTVNNTGAGTATIAEVASATGNYKDITVHVKLDDGAAAAKKLNVVAGISAGPSATAGDNLINVVRIGYFGSTDVTKGIHSSAGTAYNALNTVTEGTDTATTAAYIVTDSDYYNAVTPTAAATPHQLIAALKTKTSFTARIWVEGQDAQCTPATTLKDATIKLNLAVTA